MVEENRAARDPGEPPTWRPGKFAVWSRRWADPDDARPTMVLLQHPLDPFVVTLADAKDAGEPAGPGRISSTTYKRAHA